MVDTPDNSAPGNAPANTAASERDALRKRLTRARATLNNKQLGAAAAALEVRVLPLLEGARTVAGYFAINGEISVDRLLRCCRERGQLTLAPVINGETLTFAPFDANTPMRTVQWGIREPDVACQYCLQADDIDIVLVPLAGFDDGCNRLGMGGGFYDKSFAARRKKSAPPLLIGVAHAQQQVDSVLSDWWDVPLDHVVTDQQLFSAAGER